MPKRPCLSDEAKEATPYMVEKAKKELEYRRLNRDTNQAQGTKHDQGKLRWDLMPYDALQEVAKVLTFGANKYADRNWEKGLNYSRLIASLQRHAIDEFYISNKQQDEETGLHPLAHAVCCLLFLLSFELRGQRPELDDIHPINPTHKDTNLLKGG